MLYKRRERFNRASERLGSVLSRVPLSANQWTLLSLLTALLTGALIVFHYFLAAAFFLAVTALLDVIDGAVARQRKRAGPRGAYLDTITDRYAEFLILAAFIVVPLPSLLLPATAWILFCLVGGFMTTYAKSAAAEKHVADEVRGGLMERSERLLLLIVAAIAAAFSSLAVVAVLAIFAVLANVTALQRIHTAFTRSKL